jgi:hypothetical protein
LDPDSLEMLKKSCCSSFNFTCPCFSVNFILRCVQYRCDKLHLYPNLSPIKRHTLTPMEEPGEQCTVVFTLIVTELASECCNPSPPSHYQVRNSSCKDDSACSPDFSMLPHPNNPHSSLPILKSADKQTRPLVSFTVESIASALRVP